MLQRRILVVLVLVLAASCRRVGIRMPSNGDAAVSYPLPDGGQLTRAAVLEAFGQCALSGYREFATLSGELAAQATKAESDPNARAIAREKWQSAIDQWEKLELFQFGPSAMSSSPGGQDLREHVYPWPLGGRCLVEQTIVSGAYLDPGFKDGLVAMRGLSVTEYLLYYDGNDHMCGSTSSVEAKWLALGEPAIKERKASYARVTATDVRARALALVAAWDPAQGNFLGDFATAGHGSQTFATDQLAFNAVSDAMFYIEYATKEMKVGKPAGIVDCMTPTCPENLESLFAHRSKRHVRNNLLGLRMLLTGCGPNATGLGFDDLLAALGRAELGADLDKATLDAIAVVDAIPEDDLETALAQDLPRVRAVYYALKNITDRLKSELVSVLDLELPKRIEGDND